MESCYGEEFWEYRGFKDEEGTYWVISVQITDGKIVDADNDCVPFGDTLQELELDLQEMLHGVKNREVLVPKDLEHLDVDKNMFHLKQMVEDS